jgi:hypothetical protein
MHSRKVSVVFLLGPSLLRLARLFVVAAMIPGCLLAVRFSHRTFSRVRLFVRSLILLISVAGQATLPLFLEGYYSGHLLLLFMSKQELSSRPDMIWLLLRRRLKQFVLGCGG